MPEKIVLIGEIYDDILNYLDSDVVKNTTPESRKKELMNFTQLHCAKRKLAISKDDILHIANELYNDFWGYGPLEHLLHDDTITEIMVNGPDEVFIERKGRLEQSHIKFRSMKHVYNIVQRMATKNNHKVDNITPILNTRLLDGSRVNAVLNPISVNSTCLNIRKFSNTPLTIDNLLEWETLTPQIVKFLDICVKSGVNILVAGGTGSGKTTLLNVLSRMIDVNERVITIEDAAELQLSVNNLVRLESRDENIEGKGSVSIGNLVKNCLRMRPDRVIVGEVRGEEAFEMLKVLNTGHEGSMSTIHSNDALSSLLRIENMVSTNNPNMSSQVIRSQIGNAIDIVVYVKRFSNGTRKITEIMDVQYDSTQEPITNFFFRYHVTKREGDRYTGKYEKKKLEPTFIKKLYHSGMYEDFKTCLDEE